ncbi:MAG: pyridoxamine 5'-phosphate oxidase family protein [Patescibacteria group bacterium]
MDKITPGIKKILEENALGFSTVDSRNRPHSIAVAYVKVFGNDVVISNSHIIESVKNLEKNKNVSLVVWNKNWENVCVGFELTGTAKNYTSGKWVDFVREMPDNAGYKINSAIVVSVKKIKKLLS